MKDAAKPVSDPLWFKDAIIYQMHVKAFFDSNNDGCGDFRGLMEKLPYLADLGVNCLWLLPFFPSPLRDDGYDIADYRGIHPSYGTMRDFRMFVKEAHARGIRVIIELVINHTSDQHAWFQEARRAPAGSAKREFYVWSDTDQLYKDARIIFLDFEKSNWSWDEEAQAYYWHRFFHHQPDLNYDNPAVLRAVVSVMRYWLDMGVDGLRLDAIPYLVERDGTNCENLPETHVVLKKLRSELDSRYQEKIFLAEANQWPADVRPYFGDGDECHMAFHFPLMPRIFMALRLEDRHPITEIMAQTPEIPENCQWALFLRNHDELTLEMVTDEERDYMYEHYARDAQMRINLGIRRRLAPLVDNNRRRLELLNSLLFSFPGTPIVYYGDELGMGDNTFLRDRNSVRTPMQWNTDRNGGFSRAEFAALYSPPIMDSVYGFQSINVEALQKNPSSLLHFMKKIIALRKAHPAFGRGKMRFLHPENRRVLVYIREHEDRVYLCTANLSRFAQPVELDLSEFRGMTPIELFGGGSFPAIGDLPYFLTLAPHGFLWFELSRSTGVDTFDTVVGRDQVRREMPRMSFQKSWNKLLGFETRLTLERDALKQFLVRQRWFGAKARTIVEVGIDDWGFIAEKPAPTYFILVEVSYKHHTSEYYFLPLCVVEGEEAVRVLDTSPRSALLRVQRDNEEALVIDAVYNPAVNAELLQAIEQRRETAMKSGELQFFPTERFSQLDVPPAELPAKLIDAEQSNSSVLYGDQLILKWFRRVEPGFNPDFEVGRFLSDVARFDRIPTTVGAVVRKAQDGSESVLGMLQRFVKNQGSGWKYLTEELRRYLERVVSHPETVLPQFPVALQKLAAQEPGEQIKELLGTQILYFAAVVGRRTGDLHQALASSASDPAFAPEPVGQDDIRRIAARMSEQVSSSFELLRANLHKVEPDLHERCHQLLGQESAIMQRIVSFGESALDCSAIRCHGDYHLGQVMVVESDVVIFDFEGEPARSLDQRREKTLPLKDVAGMLRSFDYASLAALQQTSDGRPQDYAALKRWARAVERWICASFLRDYLAVTENSVFLPKNQSRFWEVLELFLIEKACYELAYELNNRPAWLTIPLHGILNILDPENLSLILFPPESAPNAVPGEGR